MKTITFTKGKKDYSYQIPESWNEVTVSQYKKWSQDIIGASGIETIIKSISSFSGCPEDYLWDTSEAYLNELGNSIGFILTPIKDEVKDTLEINGEVYYVKKDFSQLTVGEVKAIEELMTGDLIDNLNLLFTIFVRRKVDGEWQGVTPKLLEERDKFNEVIISDVFGLFENFPIGEAL
jgi:hypothetical protein